MFSSTIAKQCSHKKGTLICVFHVFFKNIFFSLDIYMSRLFISVVTMQKYVILFLWQNKIELKFEKLTFYDFFRRVLNKLKKQTKVYVCKHLSIFLISKESFIDNANYHITNRPKKP